MNENKGNQPSTSDEIDLGQLFKLIGKGFQEVFKSFLRLFVYFRRNALPILGVAVLGVIIGLLLDTFIAKKQKLEVIVKPNMESKDYLYDVVAEVESNLRAKNRSFFSNIGVDIDNFDDFGVQIEPVTEKKGIEDEDLEFLKLLEGFESSGIVSDVIRAEIVNRSALNHRITFFYGPSGQGVKFAESVMEYINSNPFFNQLLEITRANNKIRIEKNEDLLKQVDNLIEAYTNNLSDSSSKASDGRLVLETEDNLDVTGLLGLKSSLIRDIENTRLRLIEQEQAVRVINFGRGKEMVHLLFGDNGFRIPILFVSIYLIFSMLLFFHRKSKEMNL
jgi:hypothetical protein